MKKSSVETIIEQWKKGYEVRTLAVGMGSGSHIWRPILEEGKVIQIGIFGRGQGWQDQKEEFHDIETAEELMEKEEKKDVSLDEGETFGKW
jgi:hypothetical protein